MKPTEKEGERERGEGMGARREDEKNIVKLSPILLFSSVCLPADVIFHLYL